MLDSEKWKGTKECKLLVKNQWFHHHANEILSFNFNYKKMFIESLSQQIEIKARIKTPSKNPTRGIEAKKLNEEVRRLLKKTITNLKLEVNQEDGVYYYTENKKKKVAGFDFAILNSKRNLHKLHELCFGKLRYEDGQKRWLKFLENNPGLDTYVNSTNFNKNDIKDDIPLILGEIQFGNWALAYRDFFKVLKANVQTSVDCLIYICPTGELESMLSDSIVTFNKSKKILTEFQKVISVPIWLIGLDIKI